jgi:hypothetical protein
MEAFNRRDESGFGANFANYSFWIPKQIPLWTRSGTLDTDSARSFLAGYVTLP